MIWIEWIEPFGPNNDPVYCHVTPKAAIAFKKQTYPELSDEEALTEFMVVQWAYKVEYSEKAEIAVKTKECKCLDLFVTCPIHGGFPHSKG